MSTAFFDLSGRVALVTGGSRGLGRAMVLGLAKAGTDVIIASRKVENCRTVADEVRHKTGRRAVAIGCHVGKWDDLQDLVTSAYEEFPRVDILINNAGMSPVYERLDAISEELWDKVHAVNLKAPFRLTSLIAPRMADAGGGSIINISAIGSKNPDPSVVPYVTAKAGVNALTVAMAHAYGPTVRVNCLVPGMFATDIAQYWDPEDTERRSQRLAMRRVGRPDEIVGAAIYLASDASSYTTGAVIDVDGGFRT